MNAEKTAVGAGINWKLIIKLSFSELQICQMIRKNTKEAIRLNNDRTCLFHNRRAMPRRLCPKSPSLSNTVLEEVDAAIKSMVERR